MIDHRQQWSRARDGLVSAVTALGFSAELAELMARELKSPRAIDRMASYIRQAHPNNEEMLVDEMLAIRSEIDAWRVRKESLEAQAVYSARLFYGHDDGDEEDLP